MPPLPNDALSLIAITLAAAVVNGALGYGFSSISVPLALFVVSQRVLNPALVGIEVVLNAYVLWMNRAAARAVIPRTLPIVAGLVPGVAIGVLILSRVQPSWLKLATYAALLPLILLQAAGYRRPIRRERAFGAAFGVGVGTLYAVTTISGPPLATALNNQGFSKQEFRAALGFVRLAESSFTAVAYLATGLGGGESLGLATLMLPSLLIGVPLGGFVIRHVDAETFRRCCMSFDAWIVGFGLSVLLRDLQIVRSAAAYLALLAVIVIDAWLLARFFGRRRAAAISSEA